MTSLLADNFHFSSRLGQRSRDAVAWARYLGLHESVRVPLIGLHRLLFALAGPRQGGRDLELERRVRQRYRDLLAQDFENARSGLYPMELLFDLPLLEYAQSLPRLLLDLPSVLARVRSRDYRDLPGNVALADFPAYYRRTFHWQTDGYFSRHSAELYDLGVELLFLGCGDVMRRQALAEVMRHKPHGTVRLLDVGAGTGRFLMQAARALPAAELVGVDLSPWYVQFARDRIAAAQGATHAAAPIRMQTANADALPFEDASFDVVTSVFMLHELPRRVRRGVLSEMQRVLVPGGVLVLADAAQPSDSPDLAPALRQFPTDLHEPFFSDYLKDDLAALLIETGFHVQTVAPHFVSKVVSGKRGARGANAPALAEPSS
jgi:ubiquinone/menaquinone biosynthesis C-methylase UbiE